jgi:hypothetical protein
VGKNFSEVMVLENLIRKEAITTGIIGDEHPEKAFGDLIEVVEGWAIPLTQISRSMFSSELSRCLRYGAFGKKPSRRCRDRGRTNAGNQSTRGSADFASVLSVGKVRRKFNSEKAVWG